MSSQVVRFSQAKALLSTKPFRVISLGLSVCFVGCSSVDRVGQQSGFEYVEPVAMVDEAVDDEPQELVSKTELNNNELELHQRDDNAEQQQVSVEKALPQTDTVKESAEYYREKEEEIRKKIAKLDSSIAAIEKRAKQNSESTKVVAPFEKKSEAPKTAKLAPLQVEKKALKKKELSLPEASPFEAAENERLIAEVNRLQKEQPTAAGIKPDLFGKMSDSIAAISASDRQFFKSLQAKAIKKKHSRSDFDLEWQLVQEWNGKSPNGCSITSPTVQLADKEYATQIWFDISDNRLKLNTTTNLDIAQSGVGIRADGQTLQKFSNLEYRSNAVWSGDLVETLKNSKNLTIVVGGNELGKEQQKAAIGLEGLKEVYADYLQCEETRKLVKR